MFLFFFLSYIYIVFLMPIFIFVSIQSLYPMELNAFTTKTKWRKIGYRTIKTKCWFRSNTLYILFYYYYLVCEAIGTAATPGLLCQPRVIVKMIVEKQMECTLAGETEALGENLPQRHFCPSQNPTWQDPGLNPGRRCGKPTTNRLSYGAAQYFI
jgi:hypothetical protein